MSQPSGMARNSGEPAQFAVARTVTKVRKMTIQLKAHLRQYGLLVIPVRTGREALRLWHRIASDYRQEQESEARRERRRQLIDSYLQKHPLRKLQIGAGENPLSGWLNTDLEPVSHSIIHLDAQEQFPFEDQLFDYIFSEHMIEHIPYLGGLYMLGECFRVLKPAGRIRIATPNIEQIVGLCTSALNDDQKAYIRWSMDHLGLYASQKSEFQKRRPEWALDAQHLQAYFPKQNEDPACFVVNNFFRSYGHQFLYNPSTLRSALEATGFEDVRQYEPGESDDDEIRGVEAHGQHIGETINRFETMVFEARRPA
jgi:SAM-dependent methyltransferase